MSKTHIKENNEPMSPEMVELLTKPCKSNTRFLYGKPGIIPDELLPKENEVKYVRTKDGIKKVHKINNDYLECYSVIGNNVPCYAMIHKNDVIKQADTIEELCDAKIGTFKDGSEPYIYKKISWYDLKKDWTQYHDNVYGAIWTDKGLTYVAKMNEKGELELL